MMVCRYGMAIMTRRTTFALDSESIHRLKNLSTRWEVSQAEVVRRALVQAEKTPDEEKPDPIETLKKLHASGQGLSPKKAQTYLREVYADRKRWRGK